MKSIKTGLRLTRYGMSLKMNVGIGVLYFILGIILEVVWMISGRESGLLNSWNFDLGAVFLACSAMIPVQLFLSVDVAQLAQTSPLKKKLQTNMAALVSLVNNLLVFTLILLIRLVWFFVQPELGGEAFAGLVPSVLFIFFCLIYSPFLYKYFVATLFVLVGFVFCYNFVVSYLTYSGIELFPQIPVMAQIPIYYVLIMGAAAINYGFSCILYRRPFSKNAFGAAMRPYM